MNLEDFGASQHFEAYLLDFGGGVVRFWGESPTFRLFPHRFWVHFQQFFWESPHPFGVNFQDFGFLHDFWGDFPLLWGGEGGQSSEIFDPVSFWSESTPFWGFSQILGRIWKVLGSPPFWGESPGFWGSITLGEIPHILGPPPPRFLGSSSQSRSEFPLFWVKISPFWGILGQISGILGGIPGVLG